MEGGLLLWDTLIFSVPKVHAYAMTRIKQMWRRRSWTVSPLSTPPHQRNRHPSLKRVGYHIVLQLTLSRRVIPRLPCQPSSPTTKSIKTKTTLLAAIRSAKPSLIDSIAETTKAKRWWRRRSWTRLLSLPIVESWLRTPVSGIGHALLCRVSDGYLIHQTPADDLVSHLECNARRTEW